MNAAQDPHHGNGIIATMLSDELIAHVMEWLPFRDRRRYFLCRGSLWRRARGDYEALLQNLTLIHSPPTRVPTIVTLEGFRNLVSLDMGEWATDGFMTCLASEGTAPSLKNLSMVKSLGVTDAGLGMLTHNAVRRHTLETIDITYCRNTTYAGTFPLRDRLKALKLLRRQPKWMDGVYETPFEDDNSHTYWADGTFEFERSILNSGYVCDYFLWDSSNEFHVAGKLQYNNMAGLDDLPEAIRPYYHPGVSILKLPHERAVLVAQKLRGLLPPKAFPKLAQRNLVPAGESIYLDVDGNVTEDPAQRNVMLSHIPVRPLESLMPPRDIVEKNRDRMCAHTVRNEVTVRNEITLHLALRGSAQDEETILPYLLP